MHHKKCTNLSRSRRTRTVLQKRNSSYNGRHSFHPQSPSPQRPATAGVPRSNFGAMDNIEERPKTSAPLMTGSLSTEDSPRASHRRTFSHRPATTQRPTTSKSFRKLRWSGHTGNGGDEERPVSRQSQVGTDGEEEAAHGHVHGRKRSALRKFFRVD